MSTLRNAIRAAMHKTPGDGSANTPGEIFSFCFPPDSPVFAGHFPSKPVLPAVVQIMMVEEALATLEHSTQLQGVRQAKFLSPIGPNLPLELCLACTTFPTVQASIASPLGLAAKLQLDVA